MALVADRLARRALDDELSARLVVAAKAAAEALPAERVARLEAGQESTRTYGHLRARLFPVARATGTRLFVVRPDRTALVDSEGRIPIGEPVHALERDRFEIAEAAQGRAVPSQVLFEGSDGRLYKTGYAPLVAEDGTMVAVVGADGTAASFATLRRFRRLLGTVAVAGAVLGALVAALASLSVTRPLTRLTEAARRIARGDLETPLWRRARRDEIGTLRDTLEEMRRALRARDEERETLLAGIAHEVRNPLGALDLFAGLLAEELQGRPQAPHVARIQSELAALSKVVEEFLDYARARPPLREPVDLENPARRGRGPRLAARGAAPGVGLGGRRGRGEGRPRAAAPRRAEPRAERGRGRAGGERGRGGRARWGTARRRSRSAIAGAGARRRGAGEPVPAVLHDEGEGHRARPRPREEGRRRPRRHALARGARGRRNGGAARDPGGADADERAQGREGRRGASGAAKPIAVNDKSRFQSSMVGSRSGSRPSTGSGRAALIDRSW